MDGVRAEELAGRATVGEAELEDLRGRVRGEVLAAGDAAYPEAVRLWNGMIERRPALVVRCRGAADVIAAIRFARRSELPLSVRGGGHNVAGTALSDGGLVLDLSPMRGVRVDLERRTVRVEGGATLGDVDHETQAFGLAAPFGVVTRTGVGGLTLHGGLGFLTRRLGLSCDNLVAADVVTAEGELLHADERTNPDLLWALRGGGGNFGVVTSFEFRLHPVGPDVWTVMTLFSAEHAADGLRRFREVMAAAPDELMALAVLWSAAEEEPIPEEWRGRPVLVAVGCWSGPDEQGEDAIRPLRELAPVVVADFSGRMPFVETQQLFDPDYPDGRRYYWKSVYLRDLDEPAIEVLCRHAAERPSPLSSVDVWALGGAMRREPPGGSAFSRRGDPFLVGIEANWDDPREDEANVGWARALFADLSRFAPGGSYLNFPGFAEEGETGLRASYGDSYGRLQELKARYDPDNVFRSNFNIAAG